VWMSDAGQRGLLDLALLVPQVPTECYGLYTTFASIT